VLVELAEADTSYGNAKIAIAVTIKIREKEMR
jgi:hypothetical protein